MKKMTKMRAKIINSMKENEKTKKMKWIDSADKKEYKKQAEFFLCFGKTITKQCLVGTKSFD